jgi:hypothetical protein
MTDIAAELAAIPTLPRTDLVQRWTELIGRSPPKNASRWLLVNAVAWYMQAKKYGGLKPAIKRKLISIAQSLEKGEQPAALRPRARLRTGTTIVKEWRGAKHTVTIAEGGGYSYEGKTFKSLSEIARLITGTRWNGPAFFGLRNNKNGDGATNGK